MRTDLSRLVAAPLLAAALLAAVTVAQNVTVPTVKGSWFGVHLDGTTVSTRPTVPETCFSTKVTAWRISSVMPKVSTAK